MSPPIRPELDESTLSDADLWEHKVRQGMPKEQATAYVSARKQTAAPERPLSPLERLAAGLPPNETGAEVAAREGRPGRATSFLSGVNRGASFGFFDEAGAAVGALMTGHPIKNYRKNLEYIRAKQAAAHEDHPAAEFTGTLAGAIASPASRLLGAVGAAPRSAGFWGKVGRGGLTGMAGGAVAGTGEAEGGPAERARGMGWGAGFGGALGVAIPVAGGLGRALADVLNVRPGTHAATQQAAAEVSRLRARPGAVGNIAGVGGSRAPLGRRMAEGTAKALQVESADERANELILRNLARDEVTPTQLLDEVRTAGRTAKPEALMDLGGENLHGLAQAARATPSKAKNLLPSVLHERAAGAEERVIEDLLETTGRKGRTNIRKAINALADEREKEAETLYGKVNDLTVDRPELGKFFTIDNFRKAYDRARRIATTKGVVKGEDAKMPPLDELLTPDGTLKRPLTIREIDRIKRGLDDVLDLGQRSPLDAGGLGNEEMATLREAKNAFLAAVDDVVPDYRVARNAFAGKSAMMRAYDNGRNYWKLPREEAEALIADLGDSELEAFRKGAFENVAADRIEAKIPGANPARGIDERTVDRQKLRLLFGDDASFDRFRERLAREVRMHQSKNKILGGSNTADKLMAIADMADISPEMLTQAAANPAGAVTRILSSAAAQRLKGIPPGTADALAMKLTAGATGDGQALVQALLDLQAAEGRIAQQATRRAGRSAVAGQFGGRVVNP